jgi:hypothetical protein
VSVRIHIRWAVALATLASVLALTGPVAVGGAEVPAPGGCPPANSPPVPATGALQPTATAPAAPGAILVCVGSRTITGAEFAHWLAIAGKDQPPTDSNGQSSPAALDAEVLDFLISARWQVGEAEHLRIHLTRAQVERAYVRIRNQQFPKHKQFEAFLRSSGETVGDLKFRVKLNLLSQLTIKRVSSGRRGERARARSLARFVRGFKSRWRVRTYCAAEYLTRDCGHVLSTP